MIVRVIDEILNLIKPLSNAGENEFPTTKTNVKSQSIIPNERPSDWRLDSGAAASQISISRSMCFPSSPSIMKSLDFKLDPVHLGYQEILQLFLLSKIITVNNQFFLSYFFSRFAQSVTAPCSNLRKERKEVLWSIEYNRSL